MDIKKIETLELKGIDEKGHEANYSLSDFKGQKVVLYFYPKDDTPYCTQEACDFKDNLNRIGSKARIVGVSPDNVKSHMKFKKHNSINFPLISDPEHKLSDYFNAWDKKNNSVIRSTFIIEPDGDISRHWSKVNVKGHVDEVIEELIDRV